MKKSNSSFKRIAGFYTHHNMSILFGVSFSVYWVSSSVRPLWKTIASRNSIKLKNAQIRTNILENSEIFEQYSLDNLEIILDAQISSTKLRGLHSFADEKFANASSAALSNDHCESKPINS